jgi:hypothetical protein
MHVHSFLNPTPRDGKEFKFTLRLIYPGEKPLICFELQIPELDSRAGIDDLEKMNIVPL